MAHIRTVYPKMNRITQYGLRGEVLVLGLVTYVSTDAHSGSPFEVRRHSYSEIGLLPLW